MRQVARQSANGRVRRPVNVDRSLESPALAVAGQREQIHDVIRLRLEMVPVSQRIGLGLIGETELLNVGPKPGDLRTAQSSSRQRQPVDAAVLIKPEMQRAVRKQDESAGAQVYRRRWLAVYGAENGQIDGEIGRRA